MKNRKSEDNLYTQEFYQNIQEGSLDSAKAVIPLVVDLVNPRSVADVGCGMGIWLSVFRELGIDDCLGIDGDYVEQEMLQIPHEQFLSWDLSRDFQLERTFDLAVSLEVAEHLPADCAASFINSLTKLAPVILFSAAIPFQGGANHVNEKWLNYWIEMFQSQEYIAIDYLRDKIWNNEKVEPWYRQNILIFVRQDSLNQYPLLKPEKNKVYLGNLEVVHPQIYLSQHQKLVYFQTKQQETEADLLAELEKSASLWRQLQELQTELENSYTQQQQAERNLMTELEKSTSLWSEVQQLKEKLQKSQEQQQQTKTDLIAELEKSTNLWSEVQRLKAELDTESAKSAHLGEQVQQLQTALDTESAKSTYLEAQVQQLQTIIAAMKSSKFWQIREGWFFVKNRLGFK